MKKISVCDFTLRALQDETSSELLFREKTAVASCIDSIGADKIELPAIKREKEDTIIYKTIASIVKNSILAIDAGYDEKSIDASFAAIKDAVSPCLQIILPVATAQMEYSFRAKEPVMLEKIKALVSYAKTKCDNVEFVAKDATRADIEFLKNACLAAKESGAVCICICDDAGTSLPEEISETVTEIKKTSELPLYVNLADNINMAVACAVAALKAGADGVKTAMVGSGVISTDKFAQTINSKGDSLSLATSLKMTQIHHDIKETLGLIKHESKSDVLNADGKSGVFLDSQSSLADVGEAVIKLGYDLSDEDNGKVYKALMQICEKKHSVGAKELEALIASNALQVPSTYHLESFTASCSNIGQSMAQVTLRNGDEILSGVATGDGPIDSAFRAIEQSIGYHYELDDFQIQSVTEGKEALGSALVRLRNNGKLYSGNGLSTDIVGASIRAYINALNKIVFEEN